MQPPTRVIAAGAMPRVRQPDGGAGTHVDPGLAVGTGHQGRVGHGSRPGSRHHRRPFRRYRIAPPADGRPEDHALDPAAVIGHGRHHRTEDVGDEPAPAAVRDGDRPVVIADEHDRHAVGAERDDREVGLLRQQRIDARHHARTA